MKFKKVLLVAALACAATVFAAPPPANTHVEVIFDHPEKFTDVKDSYNSPSEKARDGYLAILKEHLEQRAPRYLAEGQTLKITFTDIDMAGDFEPWRGPDFGDVRIIKDIYPPRLNFSYKVTDANGTVVMEGQEKLVELAFQMSVTTVDTQDALRYEKAMLDNWLRDKFPRQKKK